MKNPLVSVIIPNYNYAHFITETLESVRLQVYTHWECIIIDDGSTDGSQTVIENFIKLHSDERFKLIKIKNSGTSIAKNIGISKAFGEYIQFLDADDLITPGKIATGINVLLEKSVSVVFGSTMFFKNHQAQMETVQRYPKDYLLNETLENAKLIEKLVYNNFAVISSPIVKAACVKEIGGFNSELNHNEDWLFWMKIALNNPLFVYDNAEENMVKVRIHNLSAMGNFYKMFNGEKTVRLIFDKEIGDNVFLSHKEKQILQKLNHDLLALHEIRSLSVTAGFKYVLNSVWKKPFDNFNLLFNAIFKYAIRNIKGSKK